MEITLQLVSMEPNVALFPTWDMVPKQLINVSPAKKRGKEKKEHVKNGVLHDGLPIMS